MKQSKTKQINNPKNIFSQNNMKIYFLNNTENIKDPSMCKYSLEVMFLIVLQPLLSYENKDFREIYEIGPTVPLEMAQGNSVSRSNIFFFLSLHLLSFFSLQVIQSA